MKILITGSNGMLGKKLAEINFDKSISLILASKDVLDLSKDNCIEKIIKYQADVIINAAAMTNVDLCEVEKTNCWNANYVSVVNLITACQSCKAHLIHISTDFIFDGTEYPIAENALPNPLNFYGLTKLAAEIALEKSNISYCILRTQMVYDLAQHAKKNVVMWILDSLRNNKSINVYDDQFRTPTFVDDLAVACYLAAHQKATGIYHISGKDVITPYDMAMQIADYFQLNKELIVKISSNDINSKVKRPLKSAFSIEKATTGLGFEPFSFKESLKFFKK
jgi:dTDP-4-dehydrorhamnose reductase